MHYISTRGMVAPISFTEAVLMGLATDGGLLLPANLPQVDHETLRAWAKLHFADLAVEIMTPFVGTDLTRAELLTLAKRSYAHFTHPAVTPVVPLGDQYILELFHGPTAAFKDIALQWLGNLFELLLQRSGQQLNILGATSGDTGSAAIYGVRGKQQIRIFILHPQGRVSLVQERQMTTVLDHNVHNIAIKGTFDDGQRIIKDLFNNLEFKNRYNLGAINSINWARVLAQMIYYFYAWGQVTNGNPQQSVSFAVPTGNFGDIFAGFMARRMGLPIAHLLLASNKNDILTRFVHSGVYQVGQVHPTLSPSMDIQVASNFERYLYYLLGEDPAQVRDLMHNFATTGRLQLSKQQHTQVQADFIAEAVDDADTLKQIATTYRQYGYILDPHTAVGVQAAVKRPATICLATAHPAKFAVAVQQAIEEQKIPIPASLQGLLDKPTRCVTLAADSAVVQQYLCANIMSS